LIDKKDLERNLINVQERIKASALKVERDPEDIKLVVVSKGRSIQMMKAVYNLGVRDFGEYRVEQGILKTEALAELTDINWHMIGHIQSRKAKDVISIFDLIHSVDNAKLAARLDRFSGETGRITPVLLQINVSGEDTKFGFAADDESRWDELLQEVGNLFDLSNLQISGLMTMAPYDPVPENARQYFKKLTKLRQFFQNIYPEKGIFDLSMGMSGDFEVAVEEGATLLRVGSAIFGY
jgi:pyridoxal phosphate enzyme (YggS family)